MANKSVGLLTFNFGANMSGFDRAMKKAQKNLKKFGKSMQRTGQTLSRNITVPILGLGVAALKFGSDLQETDSKFQQVFSSVREEAEKTAKTFQESFGLSELSAKTMLSGTGDLLVGFGFTEDAALSLAEKVNSLAVDVASFSNFAGGSEGASIALTKALLGETESAKALGIVIRQGTKEYKDRTRAIMIEKRVSELQAKALNNLEIMYKQTEKAQGDYARTSGDFANQMRLVKEELITLAGDMGQRLIPMAQQVVDKIKDLTKWFNGLNESTKDSIVKWGLIVAAIGPALIIIGRMATGLSALIPIMGGVVKALGFLRVAIVTNPIGVLVSALALATGAFVVYKKKANDASQANNQFNGSVETLSEKMNRLTKLADDAGKGQFTLGIEELTEIIEELEKKSTKVFKKDGKMFTTIQGTVISIEDLAKKYGISVQKMMEGLEGTKLVKAKELIIKLKNAQREANNVTITGVEVTKEHKKSLDPLLKAIIAYSENFRVMGASMDGVNFKYTTFNERQQTAIQGFKMFGEILTTSLDNAMTSQENFFDSFVANIKKAIQSLLIQLAVLTLISAILPVSLGGIGKRALSTGSIMQNLGSLMGVGENTLPQLGNGGIVTGPTAALIGESGPEAVIPLNKLNQFAGGGSQNIVVTGKIVGNDIWLSNAKTQFNRLRTT